MLSEKHSPVVDRMDEHAALPTTRAYTELSPRKNCKEFCKTASRTNRCSSVASEAVLKGSRGPPPPAPVHPPRLRTGKSRLPCGSKQPHVFCEVSQPSHGSKFHGLGSRSPCTLDLHRLVEVSGARLDGNTPRSSTSPDVLTAPQCCSCMKVLLRRSFDSFISTQELCSACPRSFPRSDLPLSPHTWKSPSALFEHLILLTRIPASRKKTNSSSQLN